MGYKYSGSHKFVCDVDGMVYPSSEKRIRWDGAVVHYKNWEPRHPQELIRAVKEDTSVDNPRPEAGDGSDQGVGYNLNKADTVTPFTLVDNNYDELLFDDSTAFYCTHLPVSVF